METIEIQSPSGTVETPKAIPLREIYSIEKLNPKAIKVLYLRSDSAGCAWYRGIQPSAIINGLHGDILNQVVSNHIHPSDYKLSPESKWDMVVHQRQYLPEIFRAAQVLREMTGAKQIYEVDDDFFHIDSSNPVYPIFTNEVQDNIRKFVAAMDGIIVSTEPLKKVYGAINSNIIVVPNAVSPFFVKDIYKTKKDYNNDRINIGWTGSNCHVRDIAVLQSVIDDILKMHTNVHFVLGGWTECPQFKNIPEDRITRLPWTSDMGEYFKNLSTIDIGICPLEESVFNDSKSNLKYIELASLGIPVVASSVYPYANTIQDGKTGILVQTTGKMYKHWMSELNELIMNPLKRQAIGINARALVMDKFNQDKIGMQWIAAYKHFLKETTR
jgi:glycosyltransferase involved in cell wall biosynthesis